MPNLEIKHGAYRALIRTRGAGLNSLTFRGRDLIEPYVENAPVELFRGDVLAPWPNRIADGTYSVDGKPFKVAINEPTRQTALHGLVNRLEWDVTSHTESQVGLTTTLASSSSYPSSLDFHISYSFSNDGLSIALSATNIGNQRAPYGASIHPYLVADPGQRNGDWKLLLHCNEVLGVDPVRLLPTAIAKVSDLDYDFSEPRLIGERFIDHAFVVDPSKPREVLLTDSNGRGVKMSFTPDCNWIQIHTADRDGGESARTCLAVEPMTCPPNAFRSGKDLIWLEPTECKLIQWQISELSAAKSVDL